jgi:hypothetical protein
MRIPVSKKAPLRIAPPPPPNPSGLLPTDLRPVVQTDAEKVIAAINALWAAMPPPEGAYGEASPAAPVTALAGATTTVVSVTVTQRRSGSILTVLGVMNGTTADSATLLATLVESGGNFGSEGTVALGAGGGDFQLVTLGSTIGEGKGVPTTISMKITVTGNNASLAADAAHGVLLQVEEVLGT